MKKLHLAIIAPALAMTFTGCDILDVLDTVDTLTDVTYDNGTACVYDAYTSYAYCYDYVYDSSCPSYASRYYYSTCNDLGYY